MQLTETLDGKLATEDNRFTAQPLHLTRMWVLVDLRNDTSSQHPDRAACQHRIDEILAAENKPKPRKQHKRYLQEVYADICTLRDDLYHRQQATADETLSSEIDAATRIINGIYDHLEGDL